MVKQISTQNLKNSQPKTRRTQINQGWIQCHKNWRKTKKTYIKLRSFRNGLIVPANIRGNHPPRITKNTINKKTS